MKPRVSVLCTSYNAGAYLGKALGSVRAQTYTDWELLVMDDDSDDPETLTQLREWEQLYDSRIKVWRVGDDRSRSVRYATLLNQAAALSEGEYLTFLCGDDWYEPDRLERMVRLLDAAAKAPAWPRLKVIAYGAQVLHFEGSTHLGLRETHGVLTDAYHRVDLNSVMVPRIAFEQVHGFPATPPSPELWREADARLWRLLTSAGYVFVPVGGGPTDNKRYRSQGVDERVKAGLTPWA